MGLVGSSFLSWQESGQNTFSGISSLKPFFLHIAQAKNYG